MNLTSVIDTTITKFNLNGSDIYVKIVWIKTEKTVFEIKIHTDDNSWSGSFSKEFAEECRTDVEESEEDYYKNVKQCLTYPYDMYEFITSGDTATFKWKKNFEGTTTKLVHGQVHLNKDIINESKNVIINYLLDENLFQRKEINRSGKKVDELKMEIDQLKAEVTKCAESKISLEDCLYGKFVSILNSKKKRIQLLEDCLEKYEKS